MVNSTEIKNLVEKMLELLLVETSSIEIESLEENTFRVKIETEQAPVLIGKHGETLMALQHLLKAIVKKRYDANIMLLIDIGNYREEYENKIISIAKQKAEKVLAEDIRETFFPMNSYHRRIVHTYLMENFPDLDTSSIGVEPNRRITIQKKK